MTNISQKWNEGATIRGAALDLDDREDYEYGDHENKDSKDRIKTKEISIDMVRQFSGAFNIAPQRGRNPSMQQASSLSIYPHPSTPRRSISPLLQPASPSGSPNSNRRFVKANVHYSLATNAKSNKKWIHKKDIQRKTITLDFATVMAAQPDKRAKPNVEAVPKWEGNNQTFTCCNTTCVGGSNNTKFIFVNLLIIVMGILNFGFLLPICPWISQLESFPYMLVYMGKVCMLILVIVFEFMTHLKDPGFFPKNKKNFLGPFHPSFKYCEDCNSYRPYHTIHCSTCNACIAMADHHCPWIGTCIGQRNIIYFLIYLLLLFVEISINMVLSFATLHSFNGGMTSTPGDDYITMFLTSPCMKEASCAVPVTYNLLVPGIPAFCFVGFMLLNTIANIAQNTGNVERLKKWNKRNTDEMRRPNLGIIKNCKLACNPTCSTKHAIPSHFKFW